MTEPQNKPTCRGCGRADEKEYQIDADTFMCECGTLRAGQTVHESINRHEANMAARTGDKVHARNYFDGIRDKFGLLITAQTERDELKL